MSIVQLEPNVSVGEFAFGKNIDSYLNKDYIYYKKDTHDQNMEDYYQFKQYDLTVFVNCDNEITTINCKKECFWRQVNLIGLLYVDFLKLHAEKADSHEKVYILKSANKGQTQDVYGFDALGIQVWAWKGKIVTVSCTNYDLT